MIKTRKNAICSQYESQNKNYFWAKCYFHCPVTTTFFKYITSGTCNFPNSFVNYMIMVYFQPTFYWIFAKCPLSVAGVYVCNNCGHELFSSVTKYQHNSPWPAFTNTVRPDSVVKHEESPNALKVCNSSTYLHLKYFVCRQISWNVLDVQNMGSPGITRTTIVYV